MSIGLRSNASWLLFFFVILIDGWEIKLSKFKLHSFPVVLSTIEEMKCDDSDLSIKPTLNIFGICSE